jgi:glycerol transport system permease protein
MTKPRNDAAWLLVLPVVLVVAFSAIVPLMTVVNYSVQDTFGNNEFFWNGVEWFRELLDPSTELGRRFFDSLWRTLLFSAICLAIQIPLGIAVALSMPRRGFGVALCLVVMALPLLIPWNVVGTIWQVFARGDIGLLGSAGEPPGRPLQLRAGPAGRLGDGGCHGCVALDLAGRAALLCGAAGDPGCLLPGGPGGRRQPLGGVPCDPAAEDAARADHRGAAALHGQLHDLHRALRRDRRRPGNATTFLSIDLVKIALGQFDLGKAAAFSIVYNLIILVLCWVFFATTTRGQSDAVQEGAR